MITKHFPYFLAAVEEQSFHKAAAGRALAQDVRRILADVDQTARRVRRVAEGGLGLLRISFTEGMVSRPLLPAAIRAFRELYPDVDLRFVPMVSEQQREKMRQGELEVGFVFEEGSDREEFEVREVGMNNFVLVLPLDHPLRHAPTIRLADLAQEKFIWPSRQSSPRLFNRMLSICHERSFTPDIVVEVSSVGVASSLVAGGMGVAVVINPPPGRQAADVVMREIEDFSVPMPLSMIWRRANPSPILANFIRIVEDAHGQASSEG